MIAFQGGESYPSLCRVRKGKNRGAAHRITTAVRSGAPLADRLGRLSLTERSDECFRTPDSASVAGGQSSPCSAARLITRIGDADLCGPHRGGANGGSMSEHFQRFWPAATFLSSRLLGSMRGCGALSPDGELLGSRLRRPEDWDSALATLLPPDQGEADCLAALRIFRHREIVSNSVA